MLGYPRPYLSPCPINTVEGNPATAITTSTATFRYDQSWFGSSRPSPSLLARGRVFRLRPHQLCSSSRKHPTLTLLPFALLCCLTHKKPATYSNSVPLSLIAPTPLPLYIQTPPTPRLASHLSAVYRYLFWHALQLSSCRGCLPLRSHWTSEGK